MRQYSLLTLILFLFVFSGCQNPAKHQHGENDADVHSLPSTGAFGEEFTTEGILPASDVELLFTKSDSVEAVMSGDIIASCKHSGCWMDLEIKDQKTIHVTFKDDHFAIPLDAAGKNAKVKGIAIRELIPVETLKNYARDDGKSDEEIALITEPEWEYEFIATGVVIEE